MKRIIKLVTLLCGFQTIMLCAQSNANSAITSDSMVATDIQDSKTESVTSSKDDAHDVVIQKSKDTTKSDSKTKADTKAKTEKKKPAAKPTPLKTTLFVNGRVNSILLVITNDKNQQFKITVKAGRQYECGHKPQSLKKVVCYELSAPNTTLNQSDLNTYAAFVFNCDQKLEKYHFINIQQKHAALKRASGSKNETLFHEISEQNIYYP